MGRAPPVWATRDAGLSQDGSGYEPVAAALADLIRSLPALGLSPQDQVDVQAVAREVAHEIAPEQPNPGRLRRAGAALLWSIATGAVAGFV